MEFSDDQLRRFARHIVLPEIGGSGQARLLEAQVLVVGAGGIGSPLLLYLAAAGIGTLGIVDFDSVDRSNLQRQVLFGDADEGRGKVEAAAARIAALAPACRIIRHDIELGAHNVAGLIAGYELIADGTDDVVTRRIVHDACFAARKPLVAASVQGLDGQLTTWRGFEGPPHPCMRCVFPEPADPSALPTCAQAGVLGAAAGVMGTLQAVEVIKELLGAGSGLSGRLLLYDAWQAELRHLAIARRPECGAHCAYREGVS